MLQIAFYAYSTKKEKKKKSRIELSVFSEVKIKPNVALTLMFKKQHLIDQVVVNAQQMVL